jgi:hypothetical protein
MDIACSLPHHGCYRCSNSRHLARDCPALADIRLVDVLDKVIWQLGSKLLGMLLACLPKSKAITEQWTLPRWRMNRIFFPAMSERCALIHVP